MDFKIINKEAYSVSNWSGGKTTELYIYPETSKYKDRNFTFRISAATVDALESTFTSLPGFKRELMVLEGKTTLEHEGRYEVTLEPYKKDNFMGAWVTKSYGRASDFNLMTSEACSGSIEKVDLEPKTSIIFQSQEEQKVKQFFYPIGGDIEFQIDNKEYMLRENNLLCAEYAGKGNCKIKIQNKSLKKIKIISVFVKY